ncbi:hypothetical protein [Nakamurella aerolata]|uniref:Uncharacterized protein n=1 Tax=Nakamurella aerolata TaxID=1656892 RepID=A0A849AC13_9ACTN|nr:hypothetical protein [Nakamurella aerolata]NNG36030.1 hypothetical protein [Nakamurella aerolata]
MSRPGEPVRGTAGAPPAADPAGAERAAAAARTVPGWGLRGALGLACGLLVVLTVVTGQDLAAVSMATAVLVATTVYTVAAPGGPAAALLLIGVMGVHLAFGGPVLDVRVALLAVLMLAVHQLAGICAAVPVRAQVTLQALRPVAIRFAIAAGAGVLALVLVAVLS